MKIKKSSKQWAESRGAALVGTPLKPSHDAEQFYRLTLRRINMTNLMATENMEKKMPTHEIAELTEKRHHNLLRDVKNLIDQGAITEINFDFSEYKDAQVKSSNKALSSR